LIYKKARNKTDLQRVGAKAHSFFVSATYGSFFPYIEIRHFPSGKIVILSGKV
jgi:hypothetical protein